MNNEEQPEELYPVSIGGRVLQLPVPREQYVAMEPSRQAALYDQAMAEQVQWNDETIRQDPGWVWAARRLYSWANPNTTATGQSQTDAILRDPWRGGLSPAEISRRRGEENVRPIEELSDEEAADWLFDFAGEMFGNLSQMGLAAADVSDQPEMARALNIALARYENKSISRSGLGNVAEGVLSDITTYVGVQGLTSLIGKGAARQPIFTALRSAAFAGAVEGGTYAGADNIARQSIEMSGGTRDEFDEGELATSVGIGATIGGAVGLTLGDGLSMAARGRQRLDDAGEQVADNLADRAQATAAEVSAEAVDDTVPTFLPAADNIDVYNENFNNASLGTQAEMFPTGRPAVSEDELLEEVGVAAREALEEADQAIAEIPEGEFDSTLSLAGQRLASRLRRLLTSSNEKVRQQVIYEVAEAPNRRGTSAAVRQQALQTLADDSSRRIDDLMELQRLAEVRPEEAPIAPLLDAQLNQEMRNFVLFEELSTRANSDSGTNLRAIQGITEDSLPDSPEEITRLLEDRMEAARIRAMRAADDPAAEGVTGNWVQRFWRRSVSSLIEWQRNALLSAPKTFIANFLGPISNATLETLEESLGGVGTRFADDIAELSAERIRAMTRSMDLSFGLGLKAFDEHRIVTGVDFIDGEQAPSRAITGEAWGMIENSLGSAIVDGIGKFVRITDGIQLFTDSFVTSRLAVAEVAARARIRGRKQGLVGDALETYVERSTRDVFDPTTGAIRDKDLLNEVERIVARERANPNSSSPLRTPTDSLIAWGERIYRKHPVTRLLQPFWRTPLRLLQQGARRVPVLQQFSQSFRRDLSGQNGYRAYARARGQYAVAQGLGFAVVLGVINGYVRGEPHSSRDYRIASEGQDLDAIDSLLNANYQTLDPIAMPLRLLARVTDEMIYVAHVGDEERYADLQEQQAAAMAGILNVLYAGTVEQNMLQSLEDIIELGQVVTQPDRPDREGSVGRWVSQRVTTLYPNFLKKVEDFINPNREQGDDFASALIASTNLTEILREYTEMDLALVRTRRNMLGEPIEVDAILSTFGLYANERSDPVREELQEIMETTGLYLNNMQPRRDEINLRSQLNDSGEMSIYEEWQSNLQRTGLRERLQATFATESYRNGSYGRKGRPGYRTSVVQDIFAESRALAWELTLADNPQFRRRFYQNQQDRLLREFE